MFHLRKYLFPLILILLSPFSPTGSAGIHAETLPLPLKSAVTDSEMAAVAFTGKYQVQGRLLDRGGPLAGVRVSAGGDTVVTDERGGYAFLLSDGNYTLEFHVDEMYVPNSKEIGVQGSDVTVGDLYLNRILWKYTANGDVSILPPVIGPDGCAYLLVRLRRSVQLQEIGPDGALRRYFTVDSPNPWHFTRAPDGVFYIHDGESMIAVNPDFTLRWKFTDPGNGFIREPVIGPDGTLYFGSSGGTFYALHPDGSIRWEYSLGTGMGTLPAIGKDGTVYIPCGDGKLYAFQPDGTLKWTYAAGGGLYYTPLIDDEGTIYIGSRDDWFHAVRPDGSVKWKRKMERSMRSDAVFGPDGTMYFYTENGFLDAIDPDGTTRWTYSRVRGTPSPWVSPFSGEIWALREDLSGTIALSPDGALLWNYRSAFGIPACGPGGMIYAVMFPNDNSGIGYLYAIELGEYDPLPVAVETEEPALDSGDRSASGFTLLQNAPNPFNPSTAIRFSLKTRERVVIDIFNASGQRVARLADAFMGPGTHRMVWDGSAYASGMYLVRVSAGKETRSCKMLLTK